MANSKLVVHISGEAADMYRTRLTQHAAYSTEIELSESLRDV